LHARLRWIAGLRGGTTKVHVIGFGQWSSVQWFDDIGTNPPQAIKIRALVIDGHVKEYAVGAPHEVPERLFVVRRASPVNDSLPEDPGPCWQWQRGVGCLWTE
jgi:hypothetical protein